MLGLSAAGAVVDDVVKAAGDTATTVVNTVTQDANAGEHRGDGG